MLWLRNLAAVVFIPGTVVGLVPYLIVRSTGAVPAGGPRAAAAGLVGGIGLAIMLWSVGRFAREGQGTLAPVDPPTRLVRGGLYRYMRNPMYAGALLVLVGENVLVFSRPLMLYTALWFTAVNLFILFYEEPTLRRTFGAAYDDYCRRVGRWGL